MEIKIPITASGLTTSYCGREAKFALKVSSDYKSIPIYYFLRNHKLIIQLNSKAMKKFISLAITVAILFLTSCQKEEFENQVTPGHNPSNASNLSNPEEAFPGEVGVNEKGYLFGQPIEYLRINGKAVFQGDIILTEEQLSGIQVPTESKNGRTEAAGRALQASRWPNNTVYYVIDPSLPDQQKVIDAIAHWQASKLIKFILRSTQPNYINFKPGIGCSSAIGMTGAGQEIIVASDCTVGNIIHEIGHALGLWHEQSRGDRDSYIRINYNNIIPAKVINFQTYDLLGLDGFDNGTFDFGSIMLYGSYDFSSNGQPTITRVDGSTFSAQRTALSCGDVAIINVMYPNPLGIFSANKNWTEIPYYGDKGTYFADVTGDYRADAIVVNNNGIVVRRANGNLGVYSDGFSSVNEPWTSVAYYGDRGTFFADLTGDGKADAIVVNNNGIVVRKANANGNGFTGNEWWTTNTSFYGTIGTYFADVTGDGKADAIAIQENSIDVRTSTGSGFSGKVSWTTNAYHGSRGTYFADVTGDGKADAIVVNDYGVTVRTSTGKFFLDNAPGTTDPYYGDKGTYFADVSGDGFADAIVVNNNLPVVVRTRLISSSEYNCRQIN
jgi:hypothetical protein